MENMVFRSKDTRSSAVAFTLLWNSLMKPLDRCTNTQQWYPEFSGVTAMACTCWRRHGYNHPVETHEEDEDLLSDTEGAKYKANCCACPDGSIAEVDLKERLAFQLQQLFLMENRAYIDWFNNKYLRLGPINHESTAVLRPNVNYQFSALYHVNRLWEVSEFGSSLFQRAYIWRSSGVSSHQTQFQRLEKEQALMLSRRNAFRYGTTLDPANYSQNSYSSKSSVGARRGDHPSTPERTFKRLYHNTSEQIPSCALAKFKAPCTFPKFSTKHSVGQAEAYRSDKRWVPFLKSYRGTKRATISRDADHLGNSTLDLVEAELSQMACSHGK